MKFASLPALIEGTRDAVTLNGDLTVKDPAAFRATVIDRLIDTAVFGEGDARAAARWIIWESAWDLGIQSASIDALYAARATGAYDGKTVPAINVRAVAYDMARAVVSAAIKRNVGAFIFELARSEMEYTDQTCEEFATVMAAACIKEGYRGPIFIQGDHYQANAKKYATDPDAVIDGLKKVIREAIAAGYGNIDIDTSTLVDLSFPSVPEQQRANFERCAELAALIRDLEPAGVTISIGGEIGEVGKKNSTVAELRAFVEGFNEVFGANAAGRRGLSKISVNSGTSHGGIVLPDGSIAKVNIDFETLRNMSNTAREYGMGGAVQHGASTLPAEAFDKFPEVGTLEVHLATEFQNILYDSGIFPEDLKQEMYAYCRKELANEREATDTEEQFIYKARKKLWGPFKEQVWYLPDETRAVFRERLAEKCEFLYGKLGVFDTTELIERHIRPRRIRRPQPEALRAVAV